MAVHSLLSELTPCTVHFCNISRVLINTKSPFGAFQSFCLWDPYNNFEKGSHELDFTTLYAVICFQAQMGISELRDDLCVALFLLQIAIVMILHASIRLALALVVTIRQFIFRTSIWIILYQLFVVDDSFTAVTCAGPFL